MIFGIHVLPIGEDDWLPSPSSSSSHGEAWKMQPGNSSNMSGNSWPILGQGWFSFRASYKIYQCIMFRNLSQHNLTSWDLNIFEPWAVSMARPHWLREWPGNGRVGQGWGSYTLAQGRAAGGSIVLIYAICIYIYMYIYMYIYIYICIYIYIYVGYNIWYSMIMHKAIHV